MKCSDAEAMLAEARAIFVEPAAKPWIERPNAAVNGERIATEQTALPA